MSISTSLPGMLGRSTRGLLIGMLLTAASASFASETAAPTQAYSLSQQLKDRVGSPHSDTIAAYVAAGATQTKAHVLTDREWALVEQAVNNLPPSHQRILQKHLARLSFIEAPESVGTALTRMYEGPEGEPLFDITIRADVLDASLSSFLTHKEQSLFSDDGSGLSVKVLAGEGPALPYLLLHEASHVVDRASGLTANDRLNSDIWNNYRELAEPYAQSPLAQSLYRRAPRLPAAKSLELYTALAQSPFVSLYATASAGEDFAELAAWNTLSQRDNTPLIFEVHDRNGQVLLTVAPLEQSAVRARLQAVDAQLNQP